ncbi:Hypothetical protein IALB_2421 [Ignavibacterium album JCM 16511]|uniref:Uncharacterized protein n=1 Tax=Ignavibacterium album (strain DSM 19864 / JCM 16511 / NBRC 101810 / Mat9-16) TaxID=945713 RepID=I0AMB7_IGNAJ|nr:hypothetical protein [Ignavibacterium album]AFH50124.1 Hypothetical protein IALB_2421 [Ignavibacterium album JCM 16511]
MKPNTFIFYVLLFLMLFSFHSAYLIFSQVIIKEKVNINPKFNYNHKPEYGCSFGSCYYSLCDSSELFISFEPSSVQPGNNTIITLWLDENFTYQYNEDNYDLLQKNISSEPHCGTLTYIGEGQYLFSAPDTLTSDSVVITINYENYTHGCWGLKDGNLSKSKVSKFIEDCPDCFPYGTFLNHSYASAQLTIKWDSLYVEISPAEIYAGDTADVIIKKRLPDGSLADFDSSQSFEVATLEGCVMGNILVGDSLSNYFYDVHQPIKFVVADTVNADSALILLRVGLIEQKKTISKKTFLETNCFTGYFQSQNYQNAKGFIKQPLRIFSPTPNDTMWITEEPQMPNIICKAKLENYNEGLVNFEWEFWVSYTLHRHKYFSSDTSYTLCKRTGKIKIIGASTAINSDTTYWPVPFTFQNVDSAVFVAQHWSQCTDTILGWNEGENVFIGGYVFIQATAKNNNGKIVSFKQQNAGMILGKNPTPQAIKDYAGTNELKAIIYHESLINGVGKWKHFNPKDVDLYYKNFGWLYGWIYNKKGYPHYGVPNGFGLAKIDNNPSPTELDLWNWKNNINTSRTRLDLAKVNSNNYILRNNATFEIDKYWMNVFHHYNANKFYWNWEPINGWYENKNATKSNKYGKTVYEIYQNFNSKMEE